MHLSNILSKTIGNFNDKSGMFNIKVWSLNNILSLIFGHDLKFGFSRLSKGPLTKFKFIIGKSTSLKPVNASLSRPHNRDLKILP